jgi:non-ribosomal peptide synthetase component F
LHGARCVLFPYKQVTIGRLHDTIEAHAINALYLPCALFNCIVDERPEILAQVATVVVGGEALSLHHARKAQRCLPGVELVNGYGPTECTTFSTSYRVSELSDDHRSVPIGRPLRNVLAYVLDDAMQEVAPGEEGELYVGGPGVASGYLNRPELTAQRFLMRPSPEGGEQRLYRTGDIVRWLADGDLEFLGRNDSQIKVNGFRVEAGEVETQLCRIEGVRQAVVLLKDTGYDHKTLVAFVTGDPDIGRKTSQMRERLQTELPEYMVPREIVWLAELPLTPTGKVDRTLLQRGRTS